MKSIWKSYSTGFTSFGHTIAIVVNTVLLLFVYLVGVGLTWAFAKIVRKKFLDLQPDKNVKTYWKPLKLGKQKLEELYRQF